VTEIEGERGFRWPQNDVTPFTSRRFTACAVGRNSTTRNPLKCNGCRFLASNLLVGTALSKNPRDVAPMNKMTGKLVVFAALTLVPVIVSENMIASADMIASPPIYSSPNIIPLPGLTGSAGIIDFNFSGVGTGTPGYGFQVSGTATVYALSSWGSAPVSTWSLDGSFTGIGAATGQWRFTDTSGKESLFGWNWFSAHPSCGPNDAIPTETVFYTVTGGSGLFANASGAGGALITFWQDSGSSREIGSLVVTVPDRHEVAEPSMLSLFVAGAFALAWTMQRRRPVSVESF